MIYLEKFFLPAERQLLSYKSINHFLVSFGKFHFYM